MKLTPEEVLKVKTQNTVNIVKDSPLYKAVISAMRYYAKQEVGAVQQETPAPKWETPDDFGLYEMFDDGSFQFLHDILFWALIPSNSKNEIHLCGVDENGLYGYDLNIEDRYDTGRSLDDVEYCMRYEQRG